MRADGTHVNALLNCLKGNLQKLVARVMSEMRNGAQIYVADCLPQRRKVAAILFFHPWLIQTPLQTPLRKIAF